MDQRGERTWCEGCQAPRVPIGEVPLIELFLLSLPAWRVTGGMVPVYSEGFDRAELAALIDHSDLPCSPVDAMSAMLAMESQHRRVRAARATPTPKPKGSTDG